MTEDTALFDAADLHGSLRDPLLGSLGFLNEVMGRYPEAISFAPGAPHPDTLESVDLTACVDRFVDHEVALGATPGQARRRVYEYGPSRGLINGLVSEALRRDHGIEAGPESLVITAGAQEGMLLVLRALFASPRDVLAVANPCFVGITGSARLLDLDLVSIDESPDGIDLDGLAAACRACRAAGRSVRALYVAPDFSNPGGTTMSPACRRQLLDLAGQEDFLVIEDNTYGFTAATDQALPPLKALDTDRRVVHIGTFAKIAFPGARVGYVVADQPVAGEVGTHPLADDLATLKTVVTVNTSPLCQAVIGGLLLQHGGSLVALGRRKSALYRRNLTHLTDALDHHLGELPPAGITWNRPRGGFFVRMRLPVPADAALLEVSAQKYGVLWTPMAQFYLDSSGERQLRLSCSYLDPDQIDEGVRRLTAFVKGEVGS
ncbi:PLP-dependent aminotransferase family protein [Streptomyces sp. RB6PN25]|uniref:PLP-dependent aminotransferase family protein n=1 Tax=Streptomyces humicola TaxID=2953240 RepID=A0ABT1Q0Q9_9ACTN|nr:PLP-dependent aminotransferase family protein [Streptomyces humicola]MCQ4083508.1 PLP-dependent aminotransferase family protein [Streptomyces humicola]